MKGINAKKFPSFVMRLWVCP